jgi:diguanylate cyclase (GGDEF)-like protein
MGMDVMQMRGVRLRLLMVLIVLLAVLPIFALHVGRLQSTKDAAIEHAFEQAASLAASGAGAHEQITIQARQLLEILSQIPAVRGASLPECQEILRTVQEGREWLSGIFVVGRDGNDLCGGSELVKTLDVGDRDYFKDVRTSGTYRISDVILSRLTGEHIVVAVKPLFDARGEFQGALGIGVSLSWIDRIAAEANSQFDGILVAFDGAGRAIAYKPSIPEGWSLARLSDAPAIKTILQSKVPTFEAVDLAGTLRLFSVAQLPGSRITVAVGLDRARVLNPIERSFQIDILFLILIASLSIGLALLTAELGLLRGVRALKTTALRLKAGKMGVRVRLPSFVAAELHDLAANYNAMTAEFERLAYLDRLTGLPNRRYLERHLAKRDVRSGQAAAGHNAVLAIDIDGFKPVNDTHGHAVGDRVLATIARRIAGVVDERGLLFRVGGDEFVAVVPLIKSQDRDFARLLGEDIREAMEQPIEMDHTSFRIACSVGIALVPDDATTLAGALVLADTALYEAKRAGRNRVVDSAPAIVPTSPGSEPVKQQIFTSPTSMGVGQ